MTEWTIVIAAIIHSRLPVVEEPMKTLEERLNEVTKVDLSELENFRFMLDSHSGKTDSSLEISAKTGKEFPVNLAKEGRGLTLRISPPPGAKSAGRGAFRVINIDGTYVTGVLSSVGETTTPLRMTFSRTGTVDVEVRLVLPPDKRIVIVGPSGEITTKTPASARGSAGSRRGPDEDDASVHSAQVEANVREIYKKVMREVRDKLRAVADSLDED